jgi:hypothetical protein
MELEVAHLAVVVFVFILSVYCSPSCHRAEGCGCPCVVAQTGVKHVWLLLLISVASSKCQLCLVGASKKPALKIMLNSSSQHVGEV